MYTTNPSAREQELWKRAIRAAIFSFFPRWRRWTSKQLASKFHVPARSEPPFSRERRHDNGDKDVHQERQKCCRGTRRSNWKTIGRGTRGRSGALCQSFNVVRFGSLFRRQRQWTRHSRVEAGLPTKRPSLNSGNHER